jgi:ABC-2 type transport system ATP-binding protein
VLIINRGQLVAEDSPQNLTAKLSGGQQVKVVVDGKMGADEVIRALMAVGGVDNVEAAGEGSYLVHSSQDRSLRPALAKTIVDRGWPLMELTPVALTLEDIYLQLTADSGGDEGLWVDEDEADLAPAETATSDADATTNDA